MLIAAALFRAIHHRARDSESRKVKEMHTGVSIYSSNCIVGDYNDAVNIISIRSICRVCSVFQSGSVWQRSTVGSLKRKSRNKKYIESEKKKL